jgi:hypothetical protein
MASLPKSFNLAEPIPSLPDGAMSQLITCRPISGTSFAASAIIECDLGNRGWCDPKSVSIRYKVTQTSDASGCIMIGVPVYTPFQRVSTLVGGASIDSISQYNQVAQVLVAGQYDVAAKYGLQTSFGYSNASVGNMAYLDGRATAANTAGDTYTVAAPLLATLLTSCDKQLPLFAMPQIRFQFTLDSLTNMFIVAGGAVGIGGAVPTAFAITNFELCYTMTDLGAGVEAMVYGMGRSLLLKSHGISNSAVSVSSGSSGSLSFVFNQRFASVRSAFICPSVAIGSKWGEICDLTTNNGDYQILIGNMAFPQAPLSTVLNEAGILQETRRAFGNLYDSSNSMSIDTVEFARNVNDTVNLQYWEPGKFIVGVNLDKLQSGDHAMMSGASTYNTPISVNINVGTQTDKVANLNLILDYDAILVLDPVARQLSVRS